MTAVRSNSRKLAKAVADLLSAGCAADALNPKFTPRLRWVPAESLQSLSELVVNVAPASMTSKRLTRGAAERHIFIAIQIAKKVTHSDADQFDAEVDELVDLVESIDAWLLDPRNISLTDDALNRYSLVEVQVAEVLDWELLEESRAFQAVLLLDYFRSI